jgi:hypothetical protein
MKSIQLYYTGLLILTKINKTGETYEKKRGYIQSSVAGSLLACVVVTTAWRAFPVIVAT